MRSTRRRLSMAVKLDPCSSAPDLSTESPETGQLPQIITEPDKTKLSDEYLQHVSFPDPQLCSSNKHESLDIFHDQHIQGLTEQEIQDILFSNAPDSATNFFEQGLLPTEWAEQEFLRPASAAIPMPGSCGSGGLMSTRTISGLPPDLEFFMLQEFATLGALQLPVLDIDMVFIRYRFSSPTPLPPYLLLTLVSCGAYYSARRKVPGIDGRTAQSIYDEAKREILEVAIKELSTDSVTALSLMSFHWNGEMSSYERLMLATLSVQKVQSMRLHTNEGLRKNRTTREIGVIKYLVWLNYIVDAFAGSQNFDMNGLTTSKPPYNGIEIQLDLLEIEDTEATRIEYLTGRERLEWAGMNAFRGLVFFRGFSSLAKLQNLATNHQIAGQPLQPLVKYLNAWEEEYFQPFDLTLIPWDYANNRFFDLEGLTSGACSLNFAFWYCQCFVQFDALKDYFPVTGISTASPSSPRTIDRERQENIRACVRAFNASISIFEVLCQANYVAQLSQVLRGQLYYGGRILQLFFKNKVWLDDGLAVDSSLLGRWERCLETAELIWGFSSRGIDLAIMSLVDKQ